jgi:hypothetical protein
MGTSIRAAVAGTLMLWIAASAAAQESKSAPLAKQLTQALDAAKMTAVAARDPLERDRYVAALYLNHTLLVVSARYAVPALLDAKIDKKTYQDAYIDLQSASVSGTKVFVQDLNADGLQPGTFDSVDTQKGSIAFDGDWKKAKAASEQEYQKSLAEADEQYAKMLAVLLAAVKKS